jgi:hypothetical protein
LEVGGRSEKGEKGRIIADFGIADVGCEIKREVRGKMTVGSTKSPLTPLCIDWGHR